MNLYKNNTDREVVAVLDQSAKLTYDAQLNLLQELKKRSLQVPTTELENQITVKEQAINNLEYLKDLGFKCQVNELNGSIEIKRAMGAKIMDIIAIVVGVILFVVGLIYFWMLMAVFFGDNEFTLTKLFTYVAIITAGMIGFKMLSGINRFLDYLSFSLIQQGDNVVLKKGDLKNDEIMSVSELALNAVEGDIVFTGNAIEIMRCTADNLVHKKTLEALLNKMKEN
jgi:hypothetical protein